MGERVMSRLVRGALRGRGRWMGAGGVVGAGGVLAVCAALAAPGEVPVPSSSAQAYLAHCAACHGRTLGGADGPNIGPALRGDAFVTKWKAAAPGDMLRYVSQTMPLSDPGSLDAATYAAVTDYVRQANQLPPEGVAAASAPAPAPASKQMQAAFGAVSTGLDAAARAALAQRQEMTARMAPVTDAMLNLPPEQDWLAWRRTQATDGYSPLKQIDRENVGRLGLSWSLTLGTGTGGIAPLVHDGVMFLNASGTVRALNARNGDVIWELSRPATTTRVASSQTRSMALYGGNLYVPTLDGHLLALDARTGKLLWDHEITTAKDDLQLTAAPLPVRGKIIQGVAGCQGGGYPGGCFLVALDAKTGKELWRFNTIARPGQKGGNSWNGAPLDARFGGSIWTTGSYDPDLNLIYFGTGQTYVVSTLLNGTPPRGHTRDALYTDTTLALNPDTGKLVWHYQHAAADVWDLDWAFERTLTTLETPSGPRKVVITSGKVAIVDVLDAKTGKYLFSRDLGLQNLITAIDPRTGHKTYDPALWPEVGKLKTVCPSAGGARNWNSTAYDPTTSMLYLPMVENCMGLGLTEGVKEGEGTHREFGEFSQERRNPPNFDGNFGRVAAVNLKTREIAWTNRRRAPQSSAILVTAGGLVFEGGRDRWFRALDSASGKTLWQARLDSTPNSFPITYMVDGRQYLAITTGGGGAIDLFFADFTPELRRPAGGRTLVVFALPE